MEKTHWKKLVNPDYIGAYCIEKDTTVKIIAVNREIVKGEGGKKEECTVAKLEGMKPFILNRTNAKTITRIYNTPYIEDWVGKSITIYPTTTKVAGEVVECLRVREVMPQQMQQKDYSKEKQQLINCITQDQLKDVYLALPKDAQINLVTVKDEMKAKLTQQEGSAQ